MKTHGINIMKTASKDFLLGESSLSFYLFLMVVECIGMLLGAKNKSDDFIFRKFLMNSNRTDQVVGSSTAV